MFWRKLRPFLGLIHTTIDLGVICPKKPLKKGRGQGIPSQNEKSKTSHNFYMERPTLIKLSQIVENHVLTSAGLKTEVENNIQDGGYRHIGF